MEVDAIIRQVYPQAATHVYRAGGYQIPRVNNIVTVESSNPIKIDYLNQHFSVIDGQKIRWGISRSFEERQAGVQYAIVEAPHLTRTQVVATYAKDAAEIEHGRFSQEQIVAWNTGYKSLLKLWKRPDSLDAEARDYFKCKFASLTDYSERERVKALSILNPNQAKATCVAQYMEAMDKDDDAPDMLAGASLAEVEDKQTKWKLVSKKYAKTRLGNLSWGNLSRENASPRQGGAEYEQQFAGVERPGFLHKDHADREHAIETALTDFPAWRYLYGEVCTHKQSWCFPFLLEILRLVNLEITWRRGAMETNLHTIFLLAVASTHGDLAVSTFLP